MSDRRRRCFVHQLEKMTTITTIATPNTSIKFRNTCDHLLASAGYCFGSRLPVVRPRVADTSHRRGETATLDRICSKKFHFVLRLLGGYAEADEPLGLRPNLPGKTISSELGPMKGYTHARVHLRKLYRAVCRSSRQLIRTSSRCSTTMASPKRSVIDRHHQ